MTEERMFELLIGFSILIFVYALIIAGVATNVEAKCLEAGYSEVKIDYKLNGYCIRTFGEITEVKPVK